MSEGMWISLGIKGEEQLVAFHVAFYEKKDDTSIKKFSWGPRIGIIVGKDAAFR